MWYDHVIGYITGSIAEPDVRLTNFDLFSCVEVYVLPLNYFVYCVL